MSTKGERLIKLRNFCNKDRNEFAQICNVKLETYKSWELDRKYGLSKKGAEQICSSILKKISVECSLDWLIDGKGYEPFVIQNDHEKIKKELSLFISNHRECLTLEITQPFIHFKSTDIVAGEITEYKEIKNDTIILFQSDDSLIHIGKLVKKEIDGSIIIQDSGGRLLTFHDIKVAPIVWHRIIKDSAS